MDEDTPINALLTRQALSFFDRFEKYESQELISQSTANYMLSTEHFRLPTDPPLGLISSVQPTEDYAVIMYPYQEMTNPLCLREIHTIIRELTTGIFVLHQTPTISLEANYDLATVCNLPPAYLDTRIGQLLIAVDYMMKALWHGAYFPKEKRTKFTERWRTNLDVNTAGKAETKKAFLNEFTSAGLIDITKDPDFEKVYDNMPMEVQGDNEMAEERKFFMNNADNVSLQITLYQKEVKYFQNIYMVDADWQVSSIVRLLSNMIENINYERLKTRLQMHEEIIKMHLTSKQETMRQMELLKLLSFLVPFFMGMRKRMKIPDITQLLPSFLPDECITERELPPIIAGNNFKCRHFTFNNKYTHLHGGITIDFETDELIEATESLESEYENIVKECENYLNDLLNPEQANKDQINVPVYTVGGKKYYAFMIRMETYYGSAPQRPNWLRAFTEEIDRIAPKRLPIADIQIHENFKKNFGYKKAIKYKTPYNGLKVCAQRGLVAMFNSVSRKMPASRLGKQDEQGLSLLHHAALCNKPQIIAQLLISAIDVNVRRNNILPTGPTGLHIASRCGSLDAVACLLANYANILAVDQDGWAPIHCAAYFDHMCIIRLMIRKNSGLLELATKNDLKQTPLLLSASSGALSAVKCLIGLGAEIRVRDGEGNNLITLAAMRFHTNVLEYLIELNNPNVLVWQVLVEMLNDANVSKKDSAVKCLEVLSTSKPDHWKCILDAGGIPGLVSLLDLDSQEIQSVAASVLCNTSEKEAVRFALSAAGASKVLIKLLSSPIDDIQSRCAIILSDIACIEGNQDRIAEEGGIQALVHLLESELEDVLVNAVNALRVLCLGNPANQDAVAAVNGLEPLVEFLDVTSEDLQAGASAALAAIITRNVNIQNEVLKLGAHDPLVDLIRSSRSTTVQVKAASTIEALAASNTESQKKFLLLDAPKALIRLLKNVFVEVREQGACSMWALAGSTKTQQRYIAERITIPHIIQMLLESTEKLLYVGCMTAIALGAENITYQNQLAAADAFQQLIRLLRSPKTSQRVLLMVIKVIGILCLGVAFTNNKTTQKKIAEEGGIPVLVHIFVDPPNEEIQVEVANTLGCVVLTNKENQEKLADLSSFQFSTLLKLLRAKDLETGLRAGMALTIFAFNNTAQQFAIREAGGVKFPVFQRFLGTNNEFYHCYAAFQVVVLARVITDRDQVPLTAHGITMLVNKIHSSDNKVVVLACSLLSALSHTRAGLSDAMVTSGALDLLASRLNSNNDLVRNGAAVTLGYLTFNKTAYRLLFSMCRNMPGLFEKILKNIGDDPRINQNFISDFKQAIVIGLPAQCLEKNGGPAVQYPHFLKYVTRPHTTNEKVRTNSNSSNRAVSAPVLLQRRQDNFPPNIHVENNYLKPRPVSKQSRRPVSTSTTVSDKLAAANKSANL